MICSFPEDEIGGGELTFDLAAGTLSGWVEPFWVNVRYPLTQKSFATGATTFAATFGTGGLLEGAFHGPQGVKIVARSQGGGEGFAAVSGTMTGGCTR